MFCTARVAPEKTAFRPVLPLQFLPGLNGTTMTKMTYGEQLKHPNWQRLRLERLQAAGWKCQTCADKDTTLHVHHRRYIKGRMAWEYPAENFAVLCEQCHGQAHEIDDQIRLLLALLPVEHVPRAFALLLGFFEVDMDFRVSTPYGADERHLANVGFSARGIAGTDLTTLEVAQLGSALNAQTFVDFLRAELRRLDAELEAEIARDLREAAGDQEG